MLFCLNDGRASSASQRTNWNDAKRCCRELSIAGSSGWRLPSIGELQKIDNPGASVPGTIRGQERKMPVKGSLQLNGLEWSLNWDTADTRRRKYLLFDFSTGISLLYQRRIGS